MLKAGDFFVGPYPPGSGKKRRFIVVSDEVAGECTVVWVYTSTSMTDSTVVLTPGAHPEITAKCCVIYEEASIVAANDIRVAVKSGALTQVAPVSSQLLSDIQEGIFASDETPIGVADYCEDRF